MASDLWPGLDLRHLCAFEAVHKTGSFARAAEILGYTQPAVSQQISSLERIVGLRLFERTSGKSTVTLTEAGRIFVNHVEAVGARLATARTELDQLQKGEAATLGVGAFQSAVAKLLPPILGRLRRDAPSVQVEVTERMLDSELLEHVQHGSLDFAFAMHPFDEEELFHIDLVRDHFCLVTPEGGAFPSEIESIEELRDVPLVTYKTCRSVHMLTNQLKAAGVEPNIVFRSDDNTVLKSFVRSGFGAALLPNLWIAMGGNEGLTISPLTHLFPSRVIALTWNKNRVLTPSQLAFLEATKAIYPSTSATRMLALVTA